MNDYISFFAIVSSIATLAYAIIAFRTLYEIKKQRESTYQPEIVIEESILYINNCSSIDDKWEPNYSTKRDYITPNNELSLEYKKPYINLYNIGLGAAKDVEVKFTFNIEEYEENIKKINRSLKGTKDKFYLDTQGKGILFSECDKITHGLPNINPDINRLNHILPATTTKLSTMVYLPLLPSVFFEATMRNFVNQNYLEKKFIDPTFGDILIDITYLDINNKRHEKRLTLSCQFHLLSRSESTFKYIIQQSK